MQGLRREECRVVEGARHAACTVEMASIVRQVDVAVAFESYVAEKPRLLMNGALLVQGRIAAWWRVQSTQRAPWRWPA